MAPLYGKHLDRLSAAQLDQLARLHEQGLKQARAHMVRPSSSYIIKCFSIFIPFLFFFCFISFCFTLPLNQLDSSIHAG